MRKITQAELNTIRKAKTKEEAQTAYNKLRDEYMRYTWTAGNSVFEQIDELLELPWQTYQDWGKNVQEK